MLKTDPACASAQSIKQWERILSDYNEHNKITKKDLLELHGVEVKPMGLNTQGKTLAFFQIWEEENKLNGPFWFRFTRVHGMDYLTIFNIDPVLGLDSACLILDETMPLPTDNKPSATEVQTIVYRGREYLVQDDGNFNPVLVPAV